MQTILISFLGTGDYQACSYNFPGFTSPPEQFFCLALCEFIKPDQVISLQTHKARENHGEKLGQAFTKRGIAHTVVSIPDGKKESELWQIFAALTEHLPDSAENASIHVDITHGFRSLPMLGFLALNYLRVTRGFNIGGLHYGQFDFTDHANGTHTFDAFDLTPFLNLLEWTSGAEQFQSTGSTEILSDLLSQTQQKLWSNRDGTKPSDLPRKLKNIGTTMNQSSRTLSLLRIKHLEDTSSSLKSVAESAKNEIEDHAPAFSELLMPIVDDLTRFNSTDLNTLRELVGWLNKKGKPDAAITLANEWLTSYVMLCLGKQDHVADAETRDPYTSALNSLDGRRNIEKFSQEAQMIRTSLEEKLTVEQLQLLSATASLVSNFRNDLNHAGFNRSNSAAKDIFSTAQKAADAINKINLPTEYVKCHS